MIKDIIRRVGSLADERGFKKADFGLGENESWPIGDSSVDVAISNCVIIQCVNEAKDFRDFYDFRSSRF